MCKRNERDTFLITYYIIKDTLMQTEKSTYMFVFM